MLKLCLTGGPGAGKSEICNYLAQELEGRGYHIFFVPETATELILNGIRPNAHISILDFQRFVLEKQLAKEKLYDELVKYYPEDKILIFYDRGIMDGCAFVEKDEFKTLLDEKHLTFSDVFSHYDAVLHLVTAADGAEEFYQWNDPTKESVGNNAARSENPEQAREKDKKTLDAWVGHPHLRVFDNSTNFEGKVKRVVEEVFALLGEPIPKEVERKFLIKKPTTDELENLGYMSKTNIIQTYLKSDNPKVERRVRQRGTKENGFNFYYTEKIDIGLGERIEKENRISPNEYVSLLSEADTYFHQISKVRYCFIYDKRYYEMDLYPFDDEYAILEIELNDINEEINLPPLTIVKEVTDDKNFRNQSLAKHLSFDSMGCRNDIAKESSKENLVWIYTTGIEEPDILGSGSTYKNVIRTLNEKMAIDLSKKSGRNYLVRYRKENGRKVDYQSYDYHSKTWIDE